MKAGTSGFCFFTGTLKYSDGKMQKKLNKEQKVQGSDTTMLNKDILLAT
jgi:hypothetical protein